MWIGLDFIWLYVPKKHTYMYVWAVDLRTWSIFFREYKPGLYILALNVFISVRKDWFPLTWFIFFARQRTGIFILKIKLTERCVTNEPRSTFWKRRTSSETFCLFFLRTEIIKIHVHALVKSTVSFFLRMTLTVNVRATFRFPNMCILKAGVHVKLNGILRSLKMG